MAITLNSGQVNASVTFSGGAGMMTPSATQTVVNAAVQGNGSNQNAYTVTAGKTFYLFGVRANGGVAGEVVVFKNDGTTRVSNARMTTTTGDTVSSTTPIWAYTAGQNVVCNATNTGTYYIWGIEQ